MDVPPSGAPVTAAVRAGAAVVPADPERELRSGAELVWTALQDPPLEAVSAAARTLRISPHLVDLFTSSVPLHHDQQQLWRRRRARLLEDAAAGSRVVVLLPASYDDAHETVELGLLTVFVDGGSVLTVQRQRGPDLTALRRSLGDRVALPSDLLPALLSCVLEGYDEVLEGLEDDIDDVQAQVFDETRRSYAERIYGLKHETLQMERAVTPLADMVERLDLPRALHDRVLRLGEQVDRLDSLLDSVLSADLAQVGVRQNEDQRRISAWAAIALVPTIVAGIYGMNFQHMPELSWRYGYPMALAVIVVVCLALHEAFRRNGWLGRSHD